VTCLKNKPARNLEDEKMRVGSNGSIPEFIASVAEAIEEAVTENQYATGCEIPEEPYVSEQPTYNPGSYSERCGYDQSSWLQSNLLKTVGRAISSAPDPRLADLAKKGNATDYLMAATGKGGTTYDAVSPFGNWMGSNGIKPEKFEEDVNAGKTVALSTKDGNVGFPVPNSMILDRYGLQGNHVYTVKRVYTDDTGKKMVELSDPTGASQPRPIPMDNLNGPINQIAVG
jgi:hypothetical protein